MTEFNLSEKIHWRLFTGEDAIIKYKDVKEFVRLLKHSRISYFFVDKKSNEKDIKEFKRLFKKLKVQIKILDIDKLAGEKLI